MGVSLASRFLGRQRRFTRLLNKQFQWQQLKEAIGKGAKTCFWKRVMAELDAAESKRRKTEQVEMAKEARLCLMTYGKLIVIKLSNLKEEADVKDWTCLPPPPFEMCLDLPDHDMCPFEIDSKIYMAQTDDLSLPSEIGRAKAVSMGNVVPWPIYEIKIEEGRIDPTLEGAPFPFYKSYIANTPGSGDVYFYIKVRRRGVGERLYLARFDPIKETWMDMSAADNNLSNFITGITLKCVGASMGEKQPLKKKLPATTTVGKLKFM
ncbi:hypothetical protein HN51_002417 [Arachis hypogaea]